MKLNVGFTALALYLQEAASDPLSHSDIRGALSDQLDDLHPGQCCVMDVYGDDSSGDVVYHQRGDDGSSQMYKAPYSLGMTNGKRTAEIDEDSKTNVVPRTTYEEEADDDDSMVSTESAFKAAKLYKALPTYERFISKSERDSADSGSFAGKGKSFPILKPGDVMAAVRSMGRAGSDNVGTSTLKKNIIAIAKKKGWSKYLPKAWQGGSEDSSEAVKRAAGGLMLLESATALDTIVLTEASAVRPIPIKLIAPGAGSSAFYPKEVLQRDGPRVFKAGTHVYVNHPTAAEEAARPEGDVTKLAGVLLKDADWRESQIHKGRDLGPGLYSEVKPFSDHANLFDEKGEFLGMSIRAAGKAESRQTKNGLPVLTELTSAESVDVVTRAGAGGMILTEAARTAESNDGVENMTAAEVQRLIEAGVSAGVRKATLPSIAREKAFGLLEAVTLPDPAKKRIVERAIATLDLSVDLDEKKLGEAIAAEARTEAEYLATVTGGTGRVFGLGQAAAPTEKDLKEAKKEKKALKEARKDAVAIFESLGMPPEAAKFAARGREDAA